MDQRGREPLSERAPEEGAEQAVERRLFDQRPIEGAFSDRDLHSEEEHLIAELERLKQEQRDRLERIQGFDARASEISLEEGLVSPELKTNPEAHKLVLEFQATSRAIDKKKERHLRELLRLNRDEDVVEDLVHVAERQGVVRAVEIGEQLGRSDILKAVVQGITHHRLVAEGARVLGEQEAA